MEKEKREKERRKQRKEREKLIMVGHVGGGGYRIGIGIQYGRSVPIHRFDRVLDFHTCEVIGYQSTMIELG